MVYVRTLKTNKLHKYRRKIFCYRICFWITFNTYIFTFFYFFLPFVSQTIFLSTFHHLDETIHLNCASSITSHIGLLPKFVEYISFWLFLFFIGISYPRHFDLFSPYPGFAIIHYCQSYYLFHYFDFHLFGYFLLS